MTIDYNIMREMAGTLAGEFPTAAERRAIRAALALAEHICKRDEQATRDQNPGRKKGSVTAVGGISARLVRNSADKIAAVRDLIVIPQGDPGWEGRG